MGSSYKDAMLRSKEVMFGAMIAALVALATMLAMLATATSDAAIMAITGGENRSFEMTFKVKDQDGIVFEIYFAPRDGETLAELKARALAEIAANGWTVVSGPDGV